MNGIGKGYSKVPTWGIMITVLYAVVITTFLLPVGFLLGGMPLTDIASTLSDIYSGWLTWIALGMLITCQAALLFISVDQSEKRLRPRQHVFISVGVTAWSFALLSYAATWCVAVAIAGDNTGEAFDTILAGTPFTMLAWWVGLWILWGSAFFVHLRGSPEPVHKAVSWLLRGSILELLIAVPSHIIVRHRGDCSAPFATGLGIATGVAIMLLAFGPSVLFLYIKRLRHYRRQGQGVTA
jgi:hypothetical protein